MNFKVGDKVLCQYITPDGVKISTESWPGIIEVIDFKQAYPYIVFSETDGHTRHRYHEISPLPDPNDILKEII